MSALLFMQIIGGAIVLESLWYLTQSLKQKVETPDLEIDVATSAIHPNDLIDDHSKWLQTTKEVKGTIWSNKTPQQILNAELLNVRNDYIKHDPGTFGTDGPLLGPSSIYIGDYRNYDSVNKDA